MRLRQSAQIVGMAIAVTLIILAGVSLNTSRVRAENDDGNSDESKIKTGFDIAPVKLNLHGKNRALVGLGSYIVNAVGDCNGCHSAGPATEFLAGGNPYLGQHPKKIDTSHYLGGGRDFGPFGPGGALTHLYSRNLTPDKTGKPLGGAEFSEFLEIMRTGKDFDHIHPNCVGAPNGTCLPGPFDGSLLQVMRWPFFADMTDRDLRAIYEYLSAIPCIAGPASGLLHHDCN
jgi:hypothetical protein